ncbi:MAG: hypothetical protein J3Q66DRAFT_373659 [Benniella sp.]|nr:MAG: hypothetical protein J3Q66DRAFT_373659 [Benniella sp.]
MSHVFWSLSLLPPLIPLSLHGTNSDHSSLTPWTQPRQQRCYRRLASCKKNSSSSPYYDHNSTTDAIAPDPFLATTRDSDGHGPFEPNKSTKPSVTWTVRIKVSGTTRQRRERRFGTSSFMYSKAIRGARTT